MAAVGSKDFNSSVNVFSENGRVSNVAATKESFEVGDGIAVGAMKGNAS